MASIFRRRERSKLANDREEMRGTPRSQPLTPTSPQRPSTYGTDADMPRRESPAQSQLDRQDWYPASPNQLERKRLPDVEIDSGRLELGLMEPAGDDPATDDDYGGAAENLHHENSILKEDNASLKERLHLTAMELNRLLSEKTYERDDAYFVSKFKTLRYKITDWATQNFTGNMRLSTSPFATSFEKGEMAELAVDLNFAENFVDSAQVRFLMVEAFVWSFIVARVVGDNGHIWAGRLKDSFMSIRKVLDPSKGAWLRRPSLTARQKIPDPTQTRN
jgi:hypothetical protein